MPSTLVAMHADPIELLMTMSIWYRFAWRLSFDSISIPFPPPQLPLLRPCGRRFLGKPIWVILEMVISYWMDFNTLGKVAITTPFNEMSTVDVVWRLPIAGERLFSQLFARMSMTFEHFSRNRWKKSNYFSRIKFSDSFCCCTFPAKRKEKQTFSSTYNASTYK